MTNPATNRITEERLMQALDYLASTDEMIAQAKSYMDALNDQKKTIKAEEYLKCTGTQGDKTEKAFNSVAYRCLLDRIKDATYNYEILRNKRQTQSLIVDVWRSLNSARKQGVVI